MGEEMSSAEKFVAFCAHRDHLMTAGFHGHYDTSVIFHDLHPLDVGRAEKLNVSKAMLLELVRTFGNEGAEDVLDRLDLLGDLPDQAAAERSVYCNAALRSAYAAGQRRG
jgi:hypothetical protein